MLPMKNNSNSKTHEQVPFRLGTLNCRTLKNEIKLIDTALEVKRLSYGLLAVQEHRLAQNKTIDLGDFHRELENWKFVFSGFKKSGQAGVGLIFDNSNVKLIEEHIIIPGRLVFYRLFVKGNKVILSNIYAPTNSKDDQTRSNFYKQLQQESDNFCSKFRKWGYISVGDIIATNRYDSLELGLEFLGKNNAT